MPVKKYARLLILLSVFILLFGCDRTPTGDKDQEQKTSGRSYSIVGTGQNKCYDDSKEISCPEPGQPFYGQNAQYPGFPFSYKDNGDGTVTDLITGLMWQKDIDLNNKLSYDEALSKADTLDLGGYGDWRLPTIKELYSLIDFRGSSMSEKPYIDTDYFNFRYGDVSKGDRLIDAQYWSSTEYVGTTMNGNSTVFGVNFADGRIKGYPRDRKDEFVRYVRGGDGYGVNKFEDNDNGTVTDKATGLMWQKADDGQTRNWEEALAYTDDLDLAGYNDWRLPNAKELQSIVDYEKAPDASEKSKRGPAIDTRFFDISQDESYFWTNTTLLEAPPNRGGSGSQAVYFAFGQAFGFMNGKNKINVHGAGAQRSDPKSGDPADWSGGFGPQGDDIRIYNYVRAVRGGR